MSSIMKKLDLHLDTLERNQRFVHHDIKSGQCPCSNARGSFTNPHIEPSGVQKQLPQKGSGVSPIMISIAGKNQHM